MTAATANNSPHANDDTTRQVFAALESGDLAGLEKLLTAHADASSSRDASGVCLLAKARYLRRSDAVAVVARHLAEPDMIEATLLGRLDRIKRIVGDDSDAISRESADGFTPLHLACYFNQPAVATWLLENGADANAVSSNPPALCPIHSASVTGEADIVEALIKHGADVNRKQAGGFTALHAAAHNGDLKLAQILLSAGADPSAKTADGKTARDIATEKGHTKVAKRLSP